MSVTTLVRWHCYNEMPQIGWHSQQNLFSHSSGGWETQDQGVSSLGVILKPLFVAYGGHCLTVRSPGFFLGHALVGESARKLSGVSSYKRH